MKGRELRRIFRVAAAARKWLILGLAMRLAFMPFAVHSDFIATYWRAAMFLFYGRVVFPDIPAVLISHSFFLSVLSPFVPIDTWPTYTSYVLNGTFPYSLAWTDFVSTGHVFQVLFALKTPYLIFDLLGGFLLLGILDDEAQARRAFAFWMVNPLNIYVTYMFGRYEVIPLFFLLLALYYAKSRRNDMASLLLGVSTCFRLFPLLFFPSFLIGLERTNRRRIRMTLFYLLAVIPGMLLSVYLDSLSVAPPRGMFGGLESFFSYLLVPDVNWSPAGAYSFTVYLFPMGLMLLLLMQNALQKNFGSVWKMLLAILSLYYAVGYFHPQYLMWGSPLVALLIAERPRTVRLYALQLALFAVVLTRWGADLWGRIFAPISPRYFSALPSPLELLNSLAPLGLGAEVWINIFRSLFAGTCIWMLISALSPLIVLRVASLSRRSLS